MEDFYKLLTEYNTITFQEEQRPEWHNIYCISPMPTYLEVLLKRLESLDKNLLTIEVGCGYGDVLVMLINLGYKNIIGIERDEAACKAANKKIQSLFKTDKEYVICTDYPVKLDYTPEIYIQVNNVYIESLAKKEAYIERNKKWIYYNGTPKYVFIEFIDAIYAEKSNHYPSFIRLTLNEVKLMFSDFDVLSFKTYGYPKNTSSKCLYELKKKLGNPSHPEDYNVYKT